MFQLVTLEERLSTPTPINICVFGPAGVGKTTQAKTLPPEETLFVDLEAGTLALGGWGGTVLPIRSWDEACILASVLHGPDPALAPTQKYSAAYYEFACQQMGPEMVAALKRFKYMYVDSITVAGRLAKIWAEQQPESISERTGKVDTRGVYGTLGTEIVRWIEKLQHINDKSVIVVGGLEEKEDEFGRKSFVPLIEGSKAGRELPYIFDEVFTLYAFANEEGQKYRAFVTTQDNPDGYPAKDRSGTLAPLEEPNLFKLIQKMREGQRLDVMNFQLPNQAA